MTDVDDKNDISPDGGEKQVSDGAPTVPETCAGGSSDLMGASTVAMGWTIDENAPFPQIDGYEIIEAMPAGGQGKLYRARELTPARREVVLKFPRAGVLSSDRAVALFENEVQKAASLDHPNIARIYSSGLYDRMPFYSMEFIDGVDLDEYVKETDLAQRDILELVRTICLAVQHAHQRQIVHRDLKPANIMVTRDGAIPKLLDFGLAIEETELQATIDRGVGTLVYMSPEQAAYESVTTQTDVYSLGVILYELLTSQHPHGFTQQEWRTLSPGQFRDRVANGEVIRPRRVSDRIDKELEALLLKALAHESSERYASAGDLATDINNYLTGEPLTAKAPTTAYFIRKRLCKYRVPVVIAAVVLAALIGMAVFAHVNVTWERNRAELERDKAAAAKKEAVQQRLEVETRSQLLRRALYASTIGRADSAFAAGNVSDAFELLTSCQEDLRGWEWYRLWFSRDQSRLTIGLGPLPQIFQTHLATKPIDDVVFARDGKSILTMCHDEKRTFTCIWDRSTGTSMKVPGSATGQLTAMNGSFEGVTLTLTYFEPSHYGDLATLVYTPDGKSMVVAHKSTSVLTVLNGVTFEKDREIACLATISAIAISPDGRNMAIGTTDGPIYLWNFTKSVWGSGLRGHVGTVKSLAWSADGGTLASGGEDGTVRVWHLETGRKSIISSYKHDRGVETLAVSPAGKTVIFPVDDGSIRIWDCTKDEEIGVLRGHRGRVNSIALSTGGATLISGGDDCALRVWDLTQGKLIKTLFGHAKTINSVRLSPRGDEAASASEDGTAKLWRLSGEPALATLQFKDYWKCPRVGFLGPNRILLSARDVWGYKIMPGIVVDIASGKKLFRMPGEAFAAVSSDGTRFATIDQNNKFVARNAVTYDKIEELSAHNGWVCSAILSADGKRAVGGYDRSGTIWDPISGKGLWYIDVGSYAESVAISPDGERIAAAGVRNTATWRWRPGSSTRPADNPGRSLPGNEVTVWNVSSSKLVAVLRGHERAIKSVVFSPDGGRVASASLDTTLRVWDANTGDELLKLSGGDVVNTVIFSPDGQRIVSGGADGAVKIWDARIGVKLITLNEHTRGIHSLAFSRDGRSIAAVSEGGDVTIWNSGNWGDIEKSAVKIKDFSTRIPWKDRDDVNLFLP